MDIIFDIDGTLLDISHRLHLIKKTPPDWEEFRNPLQKKWDEPRLPIIKVAVALQNADHNLLFCSGRRESEREGTLESLSRFFPPMPMLWMRKDKDFREDTKVKADMLEIIRSPDVKFPGYPPDPDPMVGRIFPEGSKGFNPVMAFDDRPSVIRMWKEHGLTVADVGNGVEF
jgi:hypothetical protein